MLRLMIPQKAFQEHHGWHSCITVQIVITKIRSRVNSMEKGALKSKI